MGASAVFQVVQPVVVGCGDAFETSNGVEDDLKDTLRFRKSLLLGSSEFLDRCPKVLDIPAGELQVHGECLQAFVYIHLSVSPNTKSMLPIEAITSAISEPSTILPVACRLPKLGVRMCTRYGFAVPSLTT